MNSFKERMMVREFHHLILTKKRQTQMKQYLSNTIKMTLVVGLLFFGLAVSSKAEEKTYTIQEFGHSVSQVPVKIGNHITNEIEDIKVYQKKNWAEGKAQLARTFTQIKGFFIKE